MDDSKFTSSPKASPPNSAMRRGSRCGQPQPFRLHTASRGEMKQHAFHRRLQELDAEEAKHRIPIAQGLPFTTDKPEILHKPPAKEQTRPAEIKLHTQRRAIERAEFNYMVASKISWLERQTQQLQRLQKIIEDEEIRTLRKELIPRAQLMPLFDRPFFPQRSTRPLTVPKEPCFHMQSSKCWRCISCSGALYRLHQPLSQIMKHVK